MSMAHITTREHGDVLGPGSHWYHLDVQGLCRTGPTLHWLCHSGELASHLTCDSTRKADLSPHLDEGS